MEQQQVNQEGEYTSIQDLRGFLAFIEKNRLFYIEDVRKWFNDYGHEKISLSKLTELLNEKFFNWYQAQSVPSNTVEEEAVEFAEWLGQQVLEYDKGNWFTPNMEKSSINNSYRVTYENPVTTKQLYSLFKQSKETTG